MAKLSLKAGSTSKLLTVFAQDSGSAVGAGLTGLAYNTGSLTAYFYREGAVSATAISLVTMTLGTWASGGFVVVDGTNLPGTYSLGIPDAALASGAKSVVVMLKGAANLAPILAEIELVAVDSQDTVRYGLTAIPNVASGSAGAIPTTGTGANQLSVASGLVTVGTNNDKTGYTASTVSDKTGYALTSGEHTSIAGDVWNAARSSYLAAGSFGMLGATLLRDNTATAGAAATITLDGSASNAVDIFKGCVILLTAGTGAGQAPRVISAYSSGRVATVAPAWTTVPDNTSKFEILGVSTPLLPGSDNRALGTADSHTSGATVAAVTGAVGSVTGAVGSVTGGVTVTTNNDKTGYALTAGEHTGVANDVWNAARSGHTTGGTFGEGVGSVQGNVTGSAASVTGAVGSVTGAVGSVTGAVGSVTAGVTVATNSDKTGYALAVAPPTAATIATQVWTEPVPGSFAGGSAGARLESAASAGDPWGTTLPGAYGAGTAGKLLGDRTGFALTSGEHTAIAADVWDAARSGHTTAGTFGQGVASVQGNLTGSAGSVTGAVGSVTGAVGSVTGAVGSVTGNVGGSVASVTGAVGSVTGAVGSVTADVGITQAGAGKVWDTPARTLSAFGFSVTVGTNTDKTGYTASTVTDKTGYSLSSAGVQAVWDFLTASIAAVGSIGKLLVDNVNATIASRLAASGYTAPPTAGQVSTQVWTEPVPGSFAGGSAGAKLSAASAAANPWDALRADHGTVGTFGEAVASVDGSVGSVRGSVDHVAGGVVGSVGSVTGAVGSVTAPVTVGTNSDKSGYALSSGEHTAISADVWDASRAGHQAASTFGLLGAEFFRDGTATAGSASTITLDSGASTVVDAYKDYLVFLFAGTGAGQLPRRITAYSSGRVASVTPNWGTNPDAATRFLLHAAPLLDKAGYGLDSSGYLAAAAAVWGTTLPGAFGANTAGQDLAAAGAGADPWAKTLPGSYGAGTAGNLFGSRLDAAVSSRSSHSAADVWAVTTRTLSSYGSLVADLAAAVWGAGSRTLSDFSGQVASVATAVWGAGTRTLSAFSFSVTVGTNNDKSNYTLADSEPAAAAAAVWEAARADHHTTGSFGEGVASVQGPVVGSVDSVTGAVGSVTGDVGGAVASVTGAVGSVTGDVGGSVASVLGAVGAVTDPVTVGENQDKAGYQLATGERALLAGEVWEALRADHRATGSFGEGVAGVLGDVAGNLTGNVAGNVQGALLGSVASLGATARAQVSAAVWDAALDDHVQPGTFGPINQRLLRDTFSLPDPAVLKQPLELRMVRGDTFKFSFTAGFNGIGQDVTDWLGFWFTAKKDVRDTDAQAIVALSDAAAGGTGIVRRTPLLGVCDVTIPAAATAAVSNLGAILFADIKGKDPDGEIITLRSGTLIVEPEVTERAT